jgi:hypothetical protein
VFLIVPEPAPGTQRREINCPCNCKLASFSQLAFRSAQPSKGRRVTVAKARAPRSFFKEGATLHPATMRLAAVLVVATFCASVVAAKNDFLGAWTPLERAARPPQRALRSPTVSSLTAGVPSAVRRAR